VPKEVDRENDGPREDSKEAVFIGKICRLVLNKTGEVRKRLQR
jgi:hypothetical protein